MIDHDFDAMDTVLRDQARQVTLLSEQVQALQAALRNMVELFRFDHYGWIHWDWGGRSKLPWEASRVVEQARDALRVSTERKEDGPHAPDS